MSFIPHRNTHSFRLTASGIFLPARKETGDITSFATSIVGAVGAGDRVFGVISASGFRRGDTLLLDSTQLVTIEAIINGATPRIVVKEDLAAYAGTELVQAGVLAVTPCIVHAMVVDFPDNVPADDLILFYDQVSIDVRTPVLAAGNLKFDLRPHSVTGGAGDFSNTIMMRHKFSSGLIVHANPLGPDAIMTVLYTPLGRKNAIYTLNR